MIPFLLSLSLQPISDANLRAEMKTCASLSTDEAQLVCFLKLTDVPASSSVSEQAPSVPPSIAVSKYGYRAVQVKSGVFEMGSKETEKNRRQHESLHQVTLSNDYWIMEKEVSQSLWQRIMGAQPAVFSECGSDCPVENISWLDAIKFANALSKKEGLDRCYSIQGSRVTWPRGFKCRGWRLPTEAEWEYAARAGDESVYAGSSYADVVAWTSENTNGQTKPSCLKDKNRFGLCDMSGNVWEWVWDGFADYPLNPAIDPIGPQSALYRVLRGGSWDQEATFSRVAFREGNHPSVRLSIIGLRLVRTAP